MAKIMINSNSNPNGFDNKDYLLGEEHVDNKQNVNFVDQPSSFGDLACGIFTDPGGGKFADQQRVISIIKTALQI